jgi:phospholipase C
MNQPDNPSVYPRRRFLQQVGAAGLAGMAAPMLGAPVASALTASGTKPQAGSTPIKHIIVCCQENRSFDTYFGTYPKLPAGYGIPAGWSNPNGSGGTVKPFHFTNLTGNGYDPNHSWSAIHSEWNQGKMNGFDTTNGKNALGYFAAADLPYYYSLLPNNTLCANYFCGVLSETYPNRLVLYSGTSGGNTSNSISNGSLNYPCILDLLKSHSITFKNYNFHCPSNYSILALFKNWATGGANNELNQSITQFMADCTNNTLPQVSFITEAPPYDEHPPASIHTGETMIESIISAVQKSAAWSSTAIFVTYDEGGGFFDHIAPPQLDAYGPGMRVPMLVVSPYAKPDYVDTAFSDHSSVLKFIEYVFALPTLASINHRFDTGTPSTNNATGGKAFPPRDGNAKLSDLTQCFNFAA